MAIVNKKDNTDNLIHIKDILSVALGKYRPAKDTDMTRIWDIWDSAVGRAIAMNAKPNAFRDGILTVNVSSSAWIHQLRFLEKEMISTINRQMENSLIKEIRFKIGKIHS